MGKYYKAGVGFVDPDWKQIEDLRKMLKEMVFQFEGLVQFVSEEEYMDWELEALFVTLLEDARKVLEPPWNPVKKPKLGGVLISKLWKEDVKDLHLLLKSYGGHQGHCAAWRTETNSPGIVGKYLNVSKCDCGWAEVEKVVRNERSGTE